jgi:MoaA/NifB/PqqE/SkfB family radical SAM enzyme
MNRFESLKVLCHRDKIETIREGKMPSPVEWIIYPSNGCIFNCEHCIMKEERLNKASLSSETMKKIPADAIQHGIRNVIFSGGGEPLTNKSTEYTAQALKRNGIKVGLNTNGLLLNSAESFDYIRISVDAASRETYKKVKGYDGWKALNKKLLEIDTSMLGLAFLVTPDNVHEILSFIKWAKCWNPNFIHIRPAHYDDDRMLPLMPGIMEMQRHIVKQYPEVFFKVDKFDGYWTEKNYSKCRSTPLIAVLAADGKFVVCQDVFKRFGDYNTQSFEDCWFSKEHQEVIDSIDINTCPRCVENKYNEVIEHFDKIEVDIL